MKQFKILDVIFNTLLFISLLIWSFIKQDFEKIILSYCIIGGWQVISMAIHEMNKWFVSKTSTRRIYHWITLFSLITMPFGFAWVLVFTAPFMAIFYTYLCYKEVYVKMQRPLAALK